MSWEWQKFESNFHKVFFNKSIENISDLTFVENKSVCPSLMYLCISKIISDTRIATAVRHLVPRTILFELTRSAVTYMKYGALGALVEVWPGKKFSLQQFHTLNINFDEYDMHDQKSLISDLTKLVITVVNKIVSKYLDGEIKIEMLDITGYPVDFEYIMCVIERFSSFKYRTSKQLSLLCDLYLTDINCRSYKLRPRFESGGIKILVRNIYFCLTYRTDKKFSWENEYLGTISSLQNDVPDLFDLAKVQGLELSRLDLRSLFVQEEVEGKFFHTVNEHFKFVTTLDLSYNAINLNRSISASNIIKNFLNNMKYLTRLDLSGNRLTNNLPVILDQINNLEYLNLTGTQLRVIDISFLVKMVKLRHLDLSNNKLSNKLNALNSAFSALTSVCVIEMEDCGFDQIHIDEILPILTKNINLQILNLRGNNSNCTSYPCFSFRILYSQQEVFDDEFHDF